MDTFARIPEITTLLQYLYLGNSVQYTRKGVITRLYMTSAGRVMVHDDEHETDWFMGLNLITLIHIIDHLKTTDDWINIKTKLTCQSIQQTERP